jgi:hypothetical protein
MLSHDEVHKWRAPERHFMSSGLHSSHYLQCARVWIPAGRRLILKRNHSRFEIRLIVASPAMERGGEL